MKKDDIFNAMTDVDEKYVEESKPKAKKHRIKWIASIAAVLAVAIAVGAVFGRGLFTNNISNGTQMNSGTNATSSLNGGKPVNLLKAAVITAQYPEVAQYPTVDENGMENEEEASAWSKANYDRKFNNVYSTSVVKNFAEKLNKELFSGKENVVYSPMSIYFALAIAAESSDSSTRAQILELLGYDSIDALRADANAAWLANYRDDGADTVILGNSLWMNEVLEYNEDLLKSLAQYYFASSFSGKMGTDDYNESLRKWLSEQTGGLLDDQISGLSMSPNTVMSILSTVYMSAKWDSTFNENETKNGFFKSANGNEEVDFMHSTDLHGTYYYSDNFSASFRNFENGGKMWFILPDEGVNVSDLLNDNAALALMRGDSSLCKDASIKVNWSMPKFDVSSELDLKDSLMRLGITDCFDSEKADFSNLTESVDGAVYVSDVKHGARLTVDEQGVKAAAYTMMILAGDAMPPSDEVDFTLDRPFIFVVTSDTGAPLFTGVVNTVK